MASLFHSDLKKWVKQGHVRARVDGGIIDGNHGPYIKLRIDNEVYNYNLDSQQVEEQFNVAPGQLVEIVHADGHKGSATVQVDIIDDGDRPVRQSAPQQRRQAPVRPGPQRPQQNRPAQRQQAPARRERPQREPEYEQPEQERGPELTAEEKAEKQAKVELKTARAAYAYMEQLCSNMIPAIRLAHKRLVPVFKELGYSPSCEDIRALAHGLAIDTKGHFDMHNMPKVHPLEAVSDRGQTNAEPQRKPTPEPRQPDPEPEPEQYDEPGIAEEDLPF